MRLTALNEKFGLAPPLHKGSPKVYRGELEGSTVRQIVACRHGRCRYNRGRE